MGVLKKLARRAGLIPPRPTLANWESLPFCRKNHREAIHAARRIKNVAKYVPEGGHGAEIGVFWAHFSEHLVDRMKPARLDLVDGWDLLFGERFPDWNAYTNYGKLTTAETMQAALDLEVGHPGIVQVHRALAEDYFASLEDEALDWIYIDAGHSYQKVISDLRSALRVVKAGGVILGDDYFERDKTVHPGVRRAVNQVTASEGLELVLEPPYQYILLRPESPRPRA